jgi:hypothetical protein
MNVDSSPGFTREVARALNCRRRFSAQACATEKRVLFQRIWTNLVFRLLVVAICAFSCVSAVAQEPEPGIRRVYVPIDQLDAVLAKDKQGVMLPQEEFAKLFNLARQNRSDKPNIPAAWVISSCIYNTGFGDQQMVLDATVTLTQFEDGWQAIRLPVRGVAVESAELDGQPARMGRAPVVPGCVWERRAL